MKDRVLVELRCQGAIAWHIYVPVRIVGTASVAIAAHAIVTGHRVDGEGRRDRATRHELAAAGGTWMTPRLRSDLPRAALFPAAPC